MHKKEMVQLHFFVSLQQGIRGATHRPFGISPIKAVTKSGASMPVARLVVQYQTHIDFMMGSIRTHLPTVVPRAVVNAGAMQPLESNRLPGVTVVLQLRRYYRLMRWRLGWRDQSSGGRGLSSLAGCGEPVDPCRDQHRGAGHSPMLPGGMM